MMRRSWSRDSVDTRFASHGRELRLRHSPIKPGRLHEIPLGLGSVADTFRSSTYFSYKIEHAITLYRVQGSSWKKGEMLAGFWTKQKPESPVQAKMEAALDPSWGNAGTHWIEIVVPAGTTVFEGTAAAQNGLLGGGVQIFLEDTRDVKVKRQGSFRAFEVQGNKAG